MKQYVSDKAITLEEWKFFSEPLLTTLLMLGWMSDAHILKPFPEAEVWEAFKKASRQE